MIIENNGFDDYRVIVNWKYDKIKSKWKGMRYQE